MEAVVSPSHSAFGAEAPLLPQLKKQWLLAVSLSRNRLQSEDDYESMLPSPEQWVSSAG